MSFRNRPVLDRKHRPRWQDELRTQRLIVAGFALAIAAALGIFGATVWFGYYDAHLRPAAAVGDVTYNVDQLGERVTIIGSELQARYYDLQGQLGGIRDPQIQQAQQVITRVIQTISSTAADSLVLSQVLAESADHYGLSVSDAAVSAEVRRRQSLAERLKLSLIQVRALPPDAKAGAKPTDADWARALSDINAIAKQINGGGDFVAIAKEKSSDPSSALGGVLGWVQGGDVSYRAYFDEAHALVTGHITAPIKDASGYHLLRLEVRQAAGPNKLLKSYLETAGVTDATYRSYVHGELLKSAFNDYFSTKVMTAYQPQREVSQIFITLQQGVPVPQERVRHFLAQPIPGQQDQSTATDAQWAAALARADAFRVEASKPDANWYAIATTSDDTGSGSKGGDLGWYDAASSKFIAEFKTAIAALAVGEISQPVKTQFGYHIIEVTAKRTLPGVEATTMVTTLRAHPDQFAKLAREQSEDTVTAAKGGDLGWVIPYQLDTTLSRAIFKLTTPNQISDPIQTAKGFYVFKLVEGSAARWVPTQQLTAVRQSGLDRWLTEIRNEAHTWIDPQYVAAPTGA